MRAALTTSFYAAPQQPDDARVLFTAALRDLGLHGTDEQIPTPLTASRGVPSALLLSREWGIQDLESRLSEAIEVSYEPRWDSEKAEFTWGLGLNEPHPRGQFNAFLAAAELGGPGRWARLSEAPLAPCPQITGVDFPVMAFARAEWIGDTLHLRSAPRRAAPGEHTSFLLSGVDTQLPWSIFGCKGAVIEPRSHGVYVTMPVVASDMTISARTSR